MNPVLSVVPKVGVFSSRREEVDALGWFADGDDSDGIQRERQAFPDGLLPEKCRRDPSPRPSGGWFARLGKMLFRQGRAAMAERLGIGLLGQIPLVQSIREAGDNGEPVALGTRPDSLAFLELGRKLVDAVNK
ncbi:MAG: hypothetical protein IJP73_03230 [Bacteroidales bacterium]|nr:hypothetical protein [Bacteroidales bacterium]